MYKKINVIVFGRGRKSQNLLFMYNGNIIEIVDTFEYLGVNFSRTGSFNCHIKQSHDKAIKAMYSVIQNVEAIICLKSIVNLIYSIKLLSLLCYMAVKFGVFQTYHLLRDYI